MNQQVLNVRLVNNHVLGSVDDAAGTPTVIGLLKQAYNKLSTSSGNTSISLNILQNRVNSLENTVNGSETTNPPIEGLTARVSDLEDVTDNQTTNIQLNATNIENLNTSYNTLNNSLNNISTGLTNSINTTNSNLSALADRVTSLDNVNNGRVKVAESAIGVLENTVAGLVEDVQGTGGALDDIIDLQADVTTLQNTVQGLHVGVGESTNSTGGERFNLYEANRNTASGDYSHAEGYLTVASGNYSHVEGSSNTASGESAHAEGSTTKATGSKSHAEGNNTQATGGGSHAEGGDTIATGIYSHAEGQQTLAYGNRSHAEGFKTIAFGDYSHAEGCTNQTIPNDAPTLLNITYYAGLYAHTEGYNTKATSTAAHAEGGYTSAISLYTHAEGYYARATGSYSHAGGWNTIANSKCMTAIGEFNKDDNVGPDTVNRLLVVGNGSGVSRRSDAFEVKDNGSVIINSTRSGTTPSLTIGPTSKAITGTTASSSSTENDDSIIATKYYVDHFLGIYPEYVDISFKMRHYIDDVSYPVLTMICKAVIQPAANNHKIINGFCFNPRGEGSSSIPTITTGMKLFIESKFTINNIDYYFEPDSDGIVDGSYIFNMPVSFIIHGYFVFNSTNHWYIMYQRGTPYSATSNMLADMSYEAWLQIYNLYGTLTPVQ